MAKPRLYLCNRPNPKGPGDGDEEEGGAGTGRGRGREGGGGKGKERKTYPPPPGEAAAGTGRAIRPVRWEQTSRRSRSPRGQKRERRRTERPQGGAQSRFDVWGGMPTPQRKTQTSWDSPQNVRTCCCRESMETSCITTMDRTWTGELQTTLHGSVAGDGLLRNQRAETPRPLEQWGAASRRFWRRNDGGFSTGVGTLRDPSFSPTSC